MDIGLALGIGSLIATAIIGGASFYFTHATSTAALQRSLQLSSRMKIAEFRMKWIDEFRLDLAQLMKFRVERISIQERERSLTKNGQSLSKESIERRREIDLEAIMLRGRLLLRLKPDSDDLEEKELEDILKDAMTSEGDKAHIQRKRILELSRILLKREWEKVKSELKQTN